MTASSVAHGLLLAAALSVFLVLLSKRLKLLRLAAPDPRFDHVGRRLRQMLVVGFGQSRQPRYRLAGALHIVIFFGFLILILRSLTLLGEGFQPGFTLPGLDGAPGDMYAAAKDVTAMLVLIACLVAMARRFLFQPARYQDQNATASHASEAYIVLSLIASLMIADALYEGSGRILGLSSVANIPMPFAAGAASILEGLSVPLLAGVHQSSFWIHNVTLLVFLCYLPVSKHFHVITAIPNVFLFNTRVGGAIKPPRHDEANTDKLDCLGVGRIEDFTWKHILDFYTCTDCGRCSDHCPAYATGTPLSPRMISIKSRDFAYSRFPMFGKPSLTNGDVSLVGDVISESELWSCTTCGACEEACPVMIEYVDKIIDMRRFLVDEGNVPPALQKPLADLEKHGNPYGKPARTRQAWLSAGDGEKPALRVLDEGDAVDLLFFTDSAGAYDPRIQKISRSMATVLNAAGVDCGTLGSDEVDSGHEARRVGEEGLFEALREQNLDAFSACSFDRVVTADPHAFNALKNDGYDLGKPILHHSQVLSDLVRLGNIVPGRLDDDRVYTFHDPCYLGRHNGIYDDPRDVLKAVPGLRTVEMDRSRNRSFCCGGGSLNLFFEGEGDQRMGEKRLEMAQAAGANVVVTACPFCMINLEDAAKTSGLEDDIEIIDLAELVAKTI
ncbi:(Fe-S)-binding protein [Bacteroidota bacterium]